MIAKREKEREREVERVREETHTQTSNNVIYTTDIAISI